MVAFHKMCFLVPLIMILFSAKEISSKFEFTNVKCETFNKTFSDFEYCFLKSVNRTYKYVSAKARLHFTPLTSLKFNLATYQRLNGYKPFLYNITVDACDFLRNKNKYPVVKFFFEIVAPYTNMNHTCPYSHDLLLNRIPIDAVNHQLTNVLPFPKGNYLFDTNWIADDINRAVVKFYGTLS